MNSLYFNIIKGNLLLNNFDSRSVILDVGCGSGDYCQELLDYGFERVYGIDVEFKTGMYTERLKKSGVIKLIDIGGASRKEINPDRIYKWPSFEAKFDVIVSKTVLEHVSNLQSFVLSSRENLAGPGSICIHYFPSKYSIIESHIGVPLAGWLSNKKYILLMCKLGFCYAKYRNRGDEAYSYLRNFTFYKKQSVIDEFFEEGGFEKVPSVSPVESHPSVYIRLMRFLPFFNYMFAVFRSRVVAYVVK